MCFWEEYVLRYSSNDDLLSSVVDAEGHMARFVDKTLRVINVLDLGTEAVIVAVTGEVSFDNQNKCCFDV